MNKATSWSHVLIAFIAGCSIAFHVGKLPAAIPLLIDQLPTSLTGAGMLVAAFSIVTGLSGFLIGGVADRVGHRRAALVGIFICASGSLMGAGASSLTWLLLTRLLEGVGYVLAVAALPSLIASSSTPHDRPLALGLWGAFVPAGMSVMLLLSPWLIAVIGWQGLWFAAGALTLAWGLVTYIAFGEPPIPFRERVAIRDSLALVGHRGPWLLFGCFIAYSAQYIAVTSFLPAMLVDQYAFTLQRAAVLGAMVVAGNVLGNVAAGWLLRRGLSKRRLLVSAAAMMGLCSLVIFDGTFELVHRVAAAVAFSVVGGLIPGTLFASAPDYLQRPGQMASMMGFLIQAAGLGQVIGPLVFSTIVKGFGSWEYAICFTLAAAALGVSCGSALKQPGHQRPSRLRRKETGTAGSETSHS